MNFYDDNPSDADLTAAFTRNSWLALVLVVAGLAVLRLLGWVG